MKTDSEARLKKWLSIVIFTIVIGLGALYYVKHREDFHLITSVSIYAVIAVSLLKIGQIIIHGLQVKILTDHFELGLKFSQWVGISRMHNFTSLFLPSAGATSLKAFYLKQTHHLGYSSFAASTALATILRLMLVAFFAVPLLLFSSLSNLSLISIPVAVLILTMSLFLFGNIIGGSYLLSWQKLKNLMYEWQMIRKDHRMIIKLILLNCFLFSANSLSVYASFRAFSIGISVVLSGVICAFTMLSNAFRLVPANLGIREGIFMGVSALYGTGINEALHAAALGRVIEIACTLLLAPGFSYFLIRGSRHNEIQQ